MDEWQLHFSKQFNNLFNGVRQICKHKMQAEFFNAMMPAHQKGRRGPSMLHVTVDIKIQKQLSQGHIEKIGVCSDKYFVLPIINTVKKEGSVKLALDLRELEKKTGR